MKPVVKAACVQMTSTRDPAVNLPVIAARVRAAVAAGATLVALPETCTFMERGRSAMRARLVAENDSVEKAVLAELARELGIHLLVGSMVVQADGADGNDGRAVNRSLLIGPDGGVRARYDKIHMFDVTLEDGETHAESASYRPGEVAVAADVAGPDGAFKLGLSICYDVRFPALYRHLAIAGADIISVPSAFTVPTGAAHWHVLLQARAIETGCFVLAPAQVGSHENGRQTYGHSLIVDPWGKIVAEAAADAPFIVAELDMAQVDTARRQLPVLTHGRSFKAPDGTQVHD